MQLSDSEPLLASVLAECSVPWASLRMVKAGCLLHLKSFVPAEDGTHLLASMVDMRQL